jgi:hypothetical protein
MIQHPASVGLEKGLLKKSDIASAARKADEVVWIYCEIKADDADDVIQLLGDCIVELHRFMPIPVENRALHARSTA